MIEVFRPGTSHVIKGITCEKNIVNEFGFEPLLENGWFLTPEECYPKETPKETLKDKVEDALEEVEEAQEALEKVQEALEEEAPKVADSKVTVPVTPVSNKASKAGKSDKTTAKTAAKK